MYSKIAPIKKINSIDGFGLLEMIVVIAMCAVLSCFVVPGWRGVIRHQKMVSSLQQLRSLLLYARDMAVSKQVPVFVCGSGDRLHCDGQWRHSIIAFMRRGSSEQTRLRVWQQLPAGWNVRWKSSLAKNTALMFQPSGDTDGQQGSFYITTRAGAGSVSRRIVVSAAGNVRIAGE